MAVTVNFPAWAEMVNEPFSELLDNQDRYILQYGGRGSGKTDSTIKKIIVRLLTAPYFKGILVRKVYDTIKDSQFEGIKNQVEEMGLNSLFTFRTSPLSITCINGNKVIARGLDKADKIKGVDNPTFVWYEEGNDMSEEDFNTVTTTIRSTKADYLQEIFSFNPEADTPNYSDFWIYKKFFKGHTSKTFRSTVTVEVDINGKKELIDYNYSVIHSTFKDNPHLPAITKAYYEDFKRTDPYYYTVWALGEWGNREVGSRFYKTFDRVLHTKALEYDKGQALHISLDENVNPYLTLTVHQVDQRDKEITIKQIDEITLLTPRNTLRATCEEFISRYRGHKEGVYIYGDRTSKKQDSKLEKGENFFTLCANYLKEFRPSTRLPSQNPGVKSRGEFISQVLAGNIKGVNIVIGENCSNSVGDYLNLQEDADGTKHKKKERDKATGVSFERYGHTSDANDYLHIELLKSQYLDFIGGGINKKPIFGSRVRRKSY